MKESVSNGNSQRATRRTHRFYCSDVGPSQGGWLLLKRESGELRRSLTLCFYIRSVARWWSSTWALLNARRQLPRFCFLLHLQPIWGTCNESKPFRLLILNGCRSITTLPRRRNFGLEDRPPLLLEPETLPVFQVLAQVRNRLGRHHHFLTNQKLIDHGTSAGLIVLLYSWLYSNG